jgi:hypothetical protein
MAAFSTSSFSKSSFSIGAFFFDGAPKPPKPPKPPKTSGPSYGRSVIHDRYIEDYAKKEPKDDDIAMIMTGII